MSFPSVTLTGGHVRLEPLAPSDAVDLAEVGAEVKIWRYMSAAPVTDIVKMKA